MDIAVDSVVGLKGGSPDLKVVDVSGHYVMVSWIDEGGREDRHIFRDVCLIPRLKKSPASTS